VASIRRRNRAKCDVWVVDYRDGAGSARGSRACPPLDLPDPLLPAAPLAGHVRVERGQQLGHDPGALVAPKFEDFLEQSMDRAGHAQFYADAPTFCAPGAAAKRRPSDLTRLPYP